MQHCDPHQEHSATDGAVASRLFEDYCRRCQDAEAGPLEPERARIADSLASVLHRHSVVRSATEALPALPNVGDELFGFRLGHELGRGAFARVFLAEQTTLAGRPVALKMTALAGDEPQTLAQLQHTHIMPIYSVHEDERTGLQAVCMPYLGGASLAQVLHVLWSTGGLPTRGEQLVQALAAVSGPLPAPTLAPAPQRPGLPSEEERPFAALGTLARLSQLDYCRAAVWLVARLAEALDHAHQRGVLHRDVKPSNVLLGADGQPLLLDFNLAHAVLGGTTAYMAPELLHALATQDAELAARVDQRADLYGLGLVLYELLTGRLPFSRTAEVAPLPEQLAAMAAERSQTPLLRRHRPDVPWSLESIARRCLAPDLSQRYLNAAELAEDLNRFLDDRPLRHAPELSWSERACKWARRHPRLLTAGLLTGAAGLLLAVGAGAVMQANVRTAAALAETERHADDAARKRLHDFDAGSRRALCFIHTTTSDRPHYLEEGRAVCERTLALYHILDREDWQCDPTWQRLDLNARRKAAEDARELLLALARAHVFLHPEQGPPRRAALQTALRLLDRAEVVRDLGASQALWLDRAFYLEQLGASAAAADARRRSHTIPPSGARDYYRIAVSHALRGDCAAAIAELDRALRLDDRHYWSHLQRGVCHQELGAFDLAAADFSACAALGPELAWSHFNYGAALHALGRRTQALDAYTTALKRNPDLLTPKILHNRGLVYLDLNQAADALADFDAARALERDDAVLHAGRGLALAHLKRPEEADAAFRLALQRAPEHPEVLLCYGFAICERSSKEAAKVFQQVLDRVPNHPRALYGLAHLRTGHARSSPEAEALFTQALDADPRCADALRGRANVLAHQGRWQQARRDIEQCLGLDPSGVSWYAAACVYALMAEKHPDTKLEKWAITRALAALQEALRRGYGQKQAAGDTDLAVLRRHPEFHRLLQTTTLLLPTKESNGAEGHATDDGQSLEFLTRRRP